MAKTRLQEKYLNEATKAMVDKFHYKNVMEIPKIEKVIINMGVGEAVTNSKALETAVAQLTTIAAQKPRKRKRDDSGQETERPWNGALLRPFYC